MKKKKAFTLIELLAVILILAIIALIVSPIVMGVVDQSNKESAARSLEGYASAINNAIGQYILNNKGKLPNDISQIDQYINANNKEKLTVTDFEIVKGSLTSLEAIIGDYICSYTKNGGATCEYYEEEIFAYIANANEKAVLAKESGVPNVCIDGGVCTDEEYTKYMEYIYSNYGVSESCFINGGYSVYCESDEDVENYYKLRDSLEGFYGINRDEVLTITFTNKRPSGSDYKDISIVHDGSVLLFNDNYNIYIYSENNIQMPENISCFFKEMTNVTEINFNGIVKTNNVTDMSSMFRECSKIESIDLSAFNTKKVTDMSYMFSSCYSLENLNIENLNTSNVTNMSAMFNLCSNLESINISSFNTSKVTTMQNMFSGCSSLTNLDVSNFDISNVMSMIYMFYGCSGLTELDLSNFNTSNVQNMYGMFYGCSGLTELDLKKFTTYDVTSMAHMFRDCSSLTSLDLSNFNTQSVIYMEFMFSGCSSLQNLNLSNFNTISVTSMSGMFYGCSSLVNLDLSSFNTSNVTLMSSMFSGCSGLTSLDLSSFNTSKTIDMSFMFNGCSNLTNLNLSSFNTSGVSTMNSMFQKCIGLVTIDISNFNTAYVSNMQSMFNGDTNLTTIYVGPNWSTNKIVNAMYSSNMFKDCTKLPNFNSSKVDKTNANTSSTGYLTLKTA